MQKNKFLFCISLITLFFFSACCDKTFCNAVKPGFENTIYFSFNTDLNNNGFLASELDTIWLEKYNKSSFTNMIERLRVDAVVVLGEDAKPEFKDYNYVLTTPDTAFRFEISDIQIGGETFTNKCTSCYHNTKKLCTVNGIIQDRSGSNEYIILKKP